MHTWNPINLLVAIPNFTWQQHLKITIPLCIWELFCIYLGSGYYLKVEIVHDPDYKLVVSQWLLWILDLDPAEL